MGQGFPAILGCAMLASSGPTIVMTWAHDTTHPDGINKLGGGALGDPGERPAQGGQ